MVADPIGANQVDPVLIAAKTRKSFKSTFGRTHKTVDIVTMHFVVV